MITQQEFTEEQKQYLQGFVAGSGIARSLAGLAPPAVTNETKAPAAPATASRDDHSEAPETIHLRAQDRFVAEGRKLCNEELAKRKRHPLDMWDDVVAHAREGKFPKGTDVFAFKFQGLFYVAPAQDAFMCRLRFPGGMVSAHQLRGVADLADAYAGGYADVTTRANLQLREIKPHDTVNVLAGLHELGIINRGAGADNVRNITASPTAGIDPHELIDTRAPARELHHHILNHRELYGLPRKFNVAFDGGGSVGVLEDTNDVAFAAGRVAAGAPVEPGVYFRLMLGGITGHGDFARDTGVLVAPDECVPVAIAAIRAFIDHGDRTDRKKARLKYVLDRLGFDRFLAEMEKHLPAPLRRVPLDLCEPRREPVKHAHIGFHAQKQEGLRYAGVVLAAGRMSSDQMRGLADVAQELGGGPLRLTVWQNIIIPDIHESRVDEARERIEALGLSTSASSIRAGLVACTGNVGCKFSASDTKRHALDIARALEPKITLDRPINIHLTGCPHSCAQHYIGDIGLLGTKVGEDAMEGYHIFVGGGYGQERALGREIVRDVRAPDAPLVIEQMLRAYLEHRSGPEETFAQFVGRHETERLKAMMLKQPVEAV